MGGSLGCGVKEGRAGQGSEGESSSDLVWPRLSRQCGVKGMVDSLDLYLPTNLPTLPPLFLCPHTHRQTQINICRWWWGWWL